jgi:hypothetical protein
VSETNGKIKKTIWFYQSEWQLPKKKEAGYPIANMRPFSALFFVKEPWLKGICRKEYSIVLKSNILRSLNS